MLLWVLSPPCHTPNCMPLATPPLVTHPPGQVRLQAGISTSTLPLANSDTIHYHPRRPSIPCAPAHLWGAPCPSEWGNILEPIFNFSNILLADPEWSLVKLHSPIQQDVLDNVLLTDDIPFAPALPMVINPATQDSGVCNVYIDNITGFFMVNPWLQLQARAVIPLAIHAVGQ